MDAYLLEYSEKMLNNGKQFSEYHNYEEAIKNFDSAITAIGLKYHKDIMIDETDLKLIIADDFKRKNELKKASDIKERVLETRIKLYKEKHEK